MANCVGVNSTAFSDISLPLPSCSSDSTDDDAVVFALPYQCSDNRDQSSSSSLCGGCQPGYAAPDVGSPHTGCVPCTSTSYGKVAMLVLTTWMLVLVYYIAANGRLGADWLFSCTICRPSPSWCHHSRRSLHGCAHSASALSASCRLHALGRGCRLRCSTPCRC